MRPRHQRVREPGTSVEGERPVAVIAAFIGNALITIAKGIAAEIAKSFARSQPSAAERAATEAEAQPPAEAQPAPAAN